MSTPEQVRQRFRSQGKTLSQWADEHGYPREAVYRVMGGGSTGVAAVQAGLRFTGVELDAHYFSVARQRIHEAATDAFPSSDPALASAPDSSPSVKGPHA